MSELQPQPAAAHKPRRRWFQYSLRTLMLAMVVLSVGFGFLGRKLQQVREQRQAVAAIQKVFVVVYYTYPASIFGGGSSKVPPGPAWLTKILGDDFWGRVDQVYFNPNGINGPVFDANLEHLKGLSQLRVLSLEKTDITDAGLEHFKGLTKLTGLDLSDTQITDAGLEHLKGLTQLKYLGAEETQEPANAGPDGHRNYGHGAEGTEGTQEPADAVAQQHQSHGRGFERVEGIQELADAVPPNQRGHGRRGKGTPGSTA